MMTKKTSTIGNPSRRRFLGSAGVMAGAATVGLGFTPNADAGLGTKTLISIFLRGGMDGLSLVPPIAGADYGHYMDARDRTLVDINASDASRRPLPLAASGFGLHPFCGGLYNLWNSGNLAIVMAAGHPPGTLTRSHFDAQEQIELGTPGEQSIHSGWLSRHLQSTPNFPANPVFTALATSGSPPLSLGAYADVATLDSPSSFHPNASTFGDTHLAMLDVLYNGTGSLDLAGQATLNAVDLVSSLDLDSYVPAGGAVYPNSSLGRDMRLIANLIKQGLGISVATVDVGGWDTHRSQNVLGSGYGSRVQNLSDSISALFTDLDASGGMNDVAIVMQSEFGRQVSENANAGTDHGLGNPMLVINGAANFVGGLYGNFPGLAVNQRDADSVVPTTDFRQVQATVVQELMGNPNLAQVFPGLSYQNVGFA